MRFLVASKKIILLFTFLCSFFSIQAIEIVTEAKPESNQYVLYIEGEDWGASADKIIIKGSTRFSAQKLNPEDFQVNITLPITSKYFSIVNEPVQVEEVYLSDSVGNKINHENSDYLTIKLKIGPDVENSDPFVHSLFNLLTNSIDISSCAHLSNNIYNYNIRNETIKLFVNTRTAVVNKLAGQFKIDSIAAKKHEVCLEYAYWETPERKENEKCPLVVWFHGMGEVGSNPYLPLLGTKAANMITDDIQKYFPEGFDLLVPQCPTGWLESEDYDPFGTRMWTPIDVESTIEKYTGPLAGILNLITGSSSKDYTKNESFDGQKKIATTSYYTKAAKKVIDTYIQEHPYIDLDRIYIGGCSAGGYMTMNMLIEYPAMFAAAFPTCEVYLDSKIKDSSIKQMAYIPMWFTQAKNDRTVNYKQNCNPTVERIKNAGAQNIHYVLFDDVHDLSGKYKDENGEPYQYSGHASWIYVLNNQSIDGKLSLFEWLSKQKR